LCPQHDFKTGITLLRRAAQHFVLLNMNTTPLMVAEPVCTLCSPHTTERSKFFYYKYFGTESYRLTKYTAYITYWVGPTIFLTSLFWFFDNHRNNSFCDTESLQTVFKFNSPFLHGLNFTYDNRLAESLKLDYFLGP
jgi:hypothetical protein